MEKVYRKGKVRLVRPKEEYLQKIEANLRESDRKEAWAGWRLRASEVVRMSVESSDDTWVILYEEEPIGIFGVSRKSFLSEIGMIWFLGTDDLEKIWFSFGKETHAVIQMFLKNYERLENWAAFDNKKTLGWLKKNGFQIESPQPYGVYGEKFCYFWQTREK